MTYSVVLSDRVVSEVIESTAWYEVQRRGLGKEFVSAVEVVLKALETNPNIYPVHRRDVRRANLRRFPFVVLYRVEENVVQVIACFHTKRSPR